MRSATLAALVLLSALIPIGAQNISKETIRFKDKDRAYYVFVPEGMKKEALAPLILTLHGSGRNGLSLVDKWKDLAKKEGIILVGPDSSHEQSSRQPEEASG